ncbi:MAG: hypothetical protein P4L95_12010 [Rouxiella aceris]|uniref:hypothetical protein n=1 Tax=Rouxiella aceris TaxID=2703884 RepID=UPI0028475ED9|nr:hypothetical protein [Rouxiella aceris]MDR3432604.1 hypothetical protein [Rouxiella aceris]
MLKRQRILDYGCPPRFLLWLILTSLIRVVGCMVIALTLTTTCYAKDSAVVQQILIQTAAHAPIQPNVAKSLSDGGLIVAGRTGSTAWAMGLDAQGQTRWQYATGLHEVFRFYGGEPEFRDIATMADGSTYLCGFMPRPLKSDLPSALLTHLDKQGRMLAEQLVTPKPGSDDKISSSSFEHCIVWGNDLVVMGQMAQIDPRKGLDGLPIIHHFYWLMKLDTTGNIIWQKFIPFKFGALSTVIARDISLFKTDHGLIFSATDSNNTEIVSLTELGDIRTRNKISGFYTLVKPLGEVGDLQLIGREPILDSSPPVTLLISLDSTLQPTRRVKKPGDDNFFANITYKMPDNTLVGFGEGMHWFGRREQGEMLHFDQQRQELQRNSLEIDGIYSAGQIWVACPANASNEFWVAKLALSEDFVNHGTSQSGFKLGMIIQRIKLQ